MSSNGKGHNRRPMQVDQETFDDNWANTFGKKEKKPEEEKQPDCAEIKPYDTLEDR